MPSVGEHEIAVEKFLELTRCFDSLITGTFKRWFKNKKSDSLFLEKAYHVLNR